ncbi:aspartate--tRNA ligase 2, cytoplasmic [Tanacetum coccineum]
MENEENWIKKRHIVDAPSRNIKIQSLITVCKMSAFSLWRYCLLLSALFFPFQMSVDNFLGNYVVSDTDQHSVYQEYVNSTSSTIEGSSRVGIPASNPRKRTQKNVLARSVQSEGSPSKRVRPSTPRVGNRRVTTITSGSGEHCSLSQTVDPPHFELTKAERNVGKSPSDPPFDIMVQHLMPVMQQLYLLRLQNGAKSKRRELEYWLICVFGRKYRFSAPYFDVSGAAWSSVFSDDAEKIIGHSDDEHHKIEMDQANIKHCLKSVHNVNVVPSVSLLKKWSNRFKFAFAEWFMRGLEMIRVEIAIYQLGLSGVTCSAQGTVRNLYRRQATGKQVVRVNQDTRLNNTVLDVRTPTNQSIFSLENKLLNLFGQLLRSKDFWQIITPNIIAGSSEGGADVFKFEYKK